MSYNAIKFVICMRYLQNAHGINRTLSFSVSMFFSDTLSISEIDTKQKPNERNPLSCSFGIRNFGRPLLPLSFKFSCGHFPLSLHVLVFRDALRQLTRPSVSELLVVTATSTSGTKRFCFTCWYISFPARRTATKRSFFL